MSNFVKILLIAFSLAMDAFAVSIALGIKEGRRNTKLAIKVSFTFALFLVAMQLIGYFLGTYIKGYFSHYTDLIAFILLLSIGLNMIREWRQDDENIISKRTYFNFLNLLFLGFATSIDDLGVGLSLSFINLNIYTSTIIIAIVTFLLSFVGVIFGFIIGDKFDKSELIGGIALISLGFYILLVD
ncbi:MAG: manganese efflux pump MntP family protein [Sphaerochaetaceae bacterium]